MQQCIKIQYQSKAWTNVLIQWFIFILLWGIFIYLYTVPVGGLQPTSFLSWVTGQRSLADAAPVVREGAPPLAWQEAVVNAVFVLNSCWSLWKCAVRPVKVRMEERWKGHKTPDNETGTAAAKWIPSGHQQHTSTCHIHCLSCSPALYCQIGLHASQCIHCTDKLVRLFRYVKLLNFKTQKE